MKADPEVKMISAEAPILFAKGCDIFITELTMRAWIHAEENKRRTLQRSDIASALAKSDMFDFLIDIVPREEAASHAKRATAGASVPTGTQLPPATQHVQSHQGHNAMPPPDYGALSGGHGINPTDDYRGSMYAAQVQPGPPAYGAAPGQQMYSEMEVIYGYPPMQAQQVRPEPEARVSLLQSPPPIPSPRRPFTPPTQIIPHLLPKSHLQTYEEHT